MSRLCCGIVGLPNIGKSTLFNALLRQKKAQASNFPFCTIDPNTGVVAIPDNRLAQLAQLSHSDKITPATITFVDIAGLVQGASKGEGLGNQFLANVRETDLLIHVVRCFDDEGILHVNEAVDPLRDVEIINLELILADLQMVENSLAKMRRQAKGDKSLQPKLDLLSQIARHLEKGEPVRTLSLSPEQSRALHPYPLLTAKEVIYIANLGEGSLESLDSDHYRKLLTYAQQTGSELLPLCATLEEELSTLDPEDGQAYLTAYNLTESGLDRLIKLSAERLHLIHFLTTGEEETRAWTIQAGSSAQEAAAKIHTDIAKGFIRAEIVPYELLIACGGRKEAKDAGKVRFEGRDYQVQDGDVILFHHHS